VFGANVGGYQFSGKAIIDIIEVVMFLSSRYMIGIR